MFQFPEFALLVYGFNQQCMASTAMRVAPLGNPRIKRCLLFPEAVSYTHLTLPTNREV